LLFLFADHFSLLKQSFLPFLGVFMLLLFFFFSLLLFLSQHCNLLSEKRLLFFVVLDRSVGFWGAQNERWEIAQKRLLFSGRSLLFFRWRGWSFLFLFFGLLLMLIFKLAQSDCFFEFFVFLSLWNFVFNCQRHGNSFFDLKSLELFSIYSNLGLMCSLFYLLNKIRWGGACSPRFFIA